ncbi:unnamed protein product [Caenorhabditis bovis]|uniref:Uncharacterized protein n=1 Tax=Caenorhabditis bovis TaxID=2654633 RepID=A0A8S1FDH9_9PELO|nr:unnamed protein product [Caenorhabditis bovis]
MLSNIVIACCVLIGALINSAPLDELQADKFCEKFPTLHMCRLRDELTGSLVELQYLLQDGPEMLSGDAPQQIQKRKSAFVRFGKRSPPTEAIDMEKRKSAFVRFGRSASSDPLDLAKKSQYIRMPPKIRSIDPAEPVRIVEIVGGTNSYSSLRMPNLSRRELDSTTQDQLNSGPNLIEIVEGPYNFLAYFQ